MSDKLLVADSFRMRERDGVPEVRGFSLHLKRFFSHVLAIPNTGLTEVHLQNFIEEFRQHALHAGDSFPRLELTADSTGSLLLQFNIRPLPPLTTGIRLEPVSGVLLESPRTKGPNIVALEHLRQRVRSEPLLTTPDGEVLEGATTSLLWWEGSVPHTVAAPDRVDSVTEQLVVQVLEAGGSPVQRSTTRVVDLKGREVWALNALHGIRVVTHIGGAPCHHPDLERLDQVRDAYDSTWEPISVGAE